MPGASTRQKRGQADQTTAQASAAPLPLPPSAADPFAGVTALKSGRGAQLRSPAAAQLMAALSLFDDQPGGSGAAAAAPAPASSSATAAAVLPTGACWPLVSLVTPDGLQTHAVAPDAEVAPGDVRDPRRLAASKRRACEE